MSGLVLQSRRPHGSTLKPIGNIPPAEAEANFYAALEKEEIAA
jgi:hypothetical protein